MIGRRGFLGLMCGIPVGAGSGRLPRPRIYSVDRGHRGEVLLNGEPVAYAVSCKTGTRGWVRYWATDLYGALDSTAGAPVLEVRRGRVLWRPFEETGRNRERWASTARGPQRVI
jgi:hypothetical protein